MVTDGGEQKYSQKNLAQCHRTYKCLFVVVSSLEANGERHFFTSCISLFS